MPIDPVGVFTNDPDLKLTRTAHYNALNTVDVASPMSFTQQA